MRPEKVMKLFAGIALVVALTAYTQTTSAHGAVVFIIAFVTMLCGYFAGDDCL